LRRFGFDLGADEENAERRRGQDAGLASRLLEAGSDTLVTFEFKAQDLKPV
jgi:hypothetical protein